MTTIEISVGENERRILAALLARYADLPLYMRAQILSSLSADLPGAFLQVDQAEAALGSDVVLDAFCE